MVTFDELQKWDADKLTDVLGAAQDAHKSLTQLGDTLDGVQVNLSEWGGDTAEAWKAEHGETRTDIDNQGHQAKSVADALGPLIQDVKSITDERKRITDEAAKWNWMIGPEGDVTGENHANLQIIGIQQQLQEDAQNLLKRATDTDREIADAMRRATWASKTPGESPPHDGYTPVTAAALMEIDPSISEAKAKEIEGPLNDVMRRGGMNTPLRQAAFISQVAIESDHFKTYREYASGAEYEGRKDLGNTSPGDGVRYKGRGAIQVTGKYNYERISRDFGVDFVNNPELLETPQYAFTSALWYWNTHNGNGVADGGNIADITLMVNGGDHALAERTAVFNKALERLGR